MLPASANSLSYGSPYLRTARGPQPDSPLPIGASLPTSIEPLEVVRLRSLMERTEGRSDLAIGLVDGPVRVDHPDLASSRVMSVGGEVGGCYQPMSPACVHGTFVAGILVARRESPAPSICPGCILVSSPIFPESASGRVPAATPEQLAEAIVGCVRAGAKIVNVSAALLTSPSRGRDELRLALDHCVRRGVIVVTAAGNEGTIGSSALTRHPGALPVVACDASGRPIRHTNLSGTIGRRGVRAPGRRVVSLGSDGPVVRMSGTSVAAPFVTGTLALLWSLVREADPIALRLAATQPTRRRPALVPPLLDAAASLAALGARRVERPLLEPPRR